MRKVLLYLIAAGLTAMAPSISRAQLVADGATNILDAVPTTATGNITIGTNGSFTLLTLTNTATVTNTGVATIGQNASATRNAVVVTGAGSIWDSPGGFYIGNGGAANTLNILDGGVVTNQFAYIGASANSNAVVVSGTNSFWNMQWTRTGQYGSLRVGSSGAGNTLVITNGGQVADGFAYIGENFSAAGNTATVTGAGSTWSHLNSSFYIGYNGSGNVLMITNGGVVTGAFATVGFQGDTNRVVVAGTNSTWSNNGLTLGGGGNSAWNEVQINGGGFMTVGGVTTIGSYNTSNIVRISDPGTYWTNGSYLDVGYNGRGNQLIVSNGAVVNVDYTHVEANGGSEEKVIITGTGSLLTNRTDFYLGFMGSSNQLLVANGGKLADNAGFIGYGGFNAISNQAVITDPNSVWTNRGNLTVGQNDARSSLVISNGAKVFNENGLIGPNSSGTNFVFVTDPGSLWSNRTDLVIGYLGSGNQVTVSNAGTVMARNVTLGFSSGSSNNLLTLNGGNVIVTNSGNANLFVWRGTVVLNSGLVQVDRLQMNTGSSGKFSLNGGVLRTLYATVNNSTPFTVGDGTNAATYVLANNQLSTGTHSFNNGLMVSSNALLTGAGTISGNVFIRDGATIAPGTTNILYLTLNNTLVMSNASFTALQLNAQSGQCRHFEGIGNFYFGGTLQLTNVAGTLASGMAFRLFYGNSYQGAFNAITPASPGSNLKWNTNQLNVDGTLRVFNLHAPPPVITNAEVAAGNLLIHANGGIAYDPCYLLTTTNLTDWEYWTTNAFDADGNVTFTNAISFSEPARFFRLQVE